MELITRNDEEMIFIGKEKEKYWFGVQFDVHVGHCWCDSVLEMVQYIKGSRLYIGNQSVGFALAESIKHPRVLEVCDGLNNCQPNSNNGYTHLDDDLIDFHINNKKQRKEIKKIDKKIKSRSKQEEDKWVIDTLSGKTNGFFIDIGAYDGETGSNSYILEKHL